MEFPSLMEFLSLTGKASPVSDRFFYYYQTMTIQLFAQTRHKLLDEMRADTKKAILIYLTKESLCSPVEKICSN